VTLQRNAVEDRGADWGAAGAEHDGWLRRAQTIRMPSPVAKVLVRGVSSDRTTVSRCTTERCNAAAGGSSVVRGATAPTYRRQACANGPSPPGGVPVASIGNRQGWRKRSTFQRVSSNTRWEETVGCALAGRGLWETCLGTIAIDWVSSRFGAPNGAVGAAGSMYSQASTSPRWCGKMAKLRGASRAGRDRHH